MTVRNHLLFSEAFFDQIRSETTDLDNLRATLSTIQATWRYYFPPPADWNGPMWSPSSPFPPDDVEQLRKIMEQILAYLELTCGPYQADGRALSLYADWAMQDRTGLCLVLPCSADIEGRDPGTGIIAKGRNYAQQLIRLLREQDLEWGVLTNGRHWRLYHRSELSPTETYLHVDLEQIVASGDMPDYLVFHRFFSRLAFARQDGRQRLDLYKEQSDRVTRLIEDHLSAHVEEIVRQLCQGLVESCRSASEDVAASETRTAIYKNALFLVYRLLFVLYAEARELLPLDLARYRAVCLRDLLAEVRDNHCQGLRYDDEDALWVRLQALFALIDQGDPAAGVPAYNGGLFDPGRRPFLTGHRICNDYLQAALIRLTAIPARGRTYDQDRDPRPIDYRDLSVRHLGSLYEGLLEYSLFVVEGEPRVIRVSGKTRQYVPYSQAGKVRANETILEVGDVYLSETAGERKATGSYYTPEEVVDYIVRHTVGAKLQELKDEFYAGRRIERQLSDLADTPADIPAHRQIQGALDDQFVDFVRRQALELKILDPAMGSGHFLVDATHAVANFVVELLNETPWENPAIDTDVAAWKRLVAERTIFGVDLNELAVELAKLCLWMTTAARGKPLTFLDHHLRWGNSLVGAWIKDVGVYPLAKKESAQAFTLPLGSFQVELDRVLAAYRELYAKSGDDVDEVREKARIYDQEIRPALQRYRELLDLHTGTYFGSGLDEQTYAQLGAAVEDPAMWAWQKELRVGDLLAQHAGSRWFHWELEFPEAFAGASRGYDVVVGNPPYVDVTTDVYVSRHYECALTRNLYAYMLERSGRVRVPGGWLGMIVPLSLVCSNRMGKLRDWLKETSGGIRLANFGIRPAQVFPGIDQRATIVVAQGKLPNKQVARIEATRFNRWHQGQLPHVLAGLQFTDITDFPDRLGWAKLGDETGRAIALKLFSQPTRIEDFLGSGWTFYYHGIGRYWLKAYDFAPVYSSDGGGCARSSTLGELSADSDLPGKTIMAILNSSLFFWYWMLYGDDFHLTAQEIAEFPFAWDENRCNAHCELAEAVDALMQDYKQKSATRTMRASGRTVTLQEFYPRRSKPIIDRIDDLLGVLYGLTAEEVEYIKNYDLEFRTDEK